MVFFVLTHCPIFWGHYSLFGLSNHVKTNLIRVDNLFHDNEIKIIKLDSKIPKVPFDDVWLFFISFSVHNIVVVDDLKCLMNKSKADKSKNHRSQKATHRVSCLSSGVDPQQ